VAGGDDSVALDLINLTSGAVSKIPVPVNQNSSSQTLVWSPDSQWLFVLSADGKLVAVNARSHRVQSLGVSLPRFTQLAISSAG
jgi:DNA-binding beta-propeller fold protein YncE